MHPFSSASVSTAASSSPDGRYGPLSEARRERARKFAASRAAASRNASSRLIPVDASFSMLLADVEDEVDAMELNDLRLAIKFASSIPDVGRKQFFSNFFEDKQLSLMQQSMTSDANSDLLSSIASQCSADSVDLVDLDTLFSEFKSVVSKQGQRNYPFVLLALRELSHCDNDSKRIGVLRKFSYRYIGHEVSNQSYDYVETASSASSMPSES